MREISIAGRKVGPGWPCFIIAEVGVSHNGDVRLARQMVKLAARVGADAVKFQSFKADRLASPSTPKAEYQMRTTESKESQLEMLRRLELSPGAHRELMNYCRQRDILFMSSPFDEESANFLAELPIEVFKIPSGEITNLPFLMHVARKGKPMIVSTGMSNLSEVEVAVRTIENVGNRDLVLLQCVSNYPADPAEANLRAMHTMAAAFDFPVGYSDHTLGIEVALAAVALGACVIEKHFTLDRTLPGPDHQASLEPDELEALVKGIRIVEAALGHGRKEPADSERQTAAVARKSIVAARNIPAGTTLTEELTAIKRPGTGLPPCMLAQVVGRVATTDIPAGRLLTLEMFK